MMDMQFEKTNEEVGMGYLDINITATREHLGKNKYGIRWLKEGAQCVTRAFIVV